MGALSFKNIDVMIRNNRGFSVIIFYFHSKYCIATMEF
jgi:hypothetical protein